MADAPNLDDKQAITDEQLIERYRAGETQAFDALVRRYRNELFHFLIRFMGKRSAAEDVFQNAFIQVHQSLDTFDTDRRFKPWLFTIAANKGRDFMRKQKRRPTVPLSAPISRSGDEGQDFVDLMQADLPMPDERMQDEELAGKVRQAVDAMPEHLREILMLAYFEKLPYAEIADVLGIPLGTVKSRLHAAVGQFAEKWKSANPQDAEP